MRDLDLRALNSATKYPSIATYHDLDKTNGNLLESGNPFAGHDGAVHISEKLDGTNARIICVGDDWFIGSREELLTAAGDRIPNPKLGIVDALDAIAESFTIRPSDAEVIVFYVEVYGNRKLPAWKNYGDGSVSGVRCFDVALVPFAVLDKPIEEIALWRDRGGQTFMSARDLVISWAMLPGMPLVPSVTDYPADKLPETIEDMRDFLAEALPATRAAVTEGGSTGRPEGLVLRTNDRRIIRKARNEDYDRTLKRRGGGR